MAQTYLKNGYILTMGPDMQVYDGGGLLVQDDTILAVGQVDPALVRPDAEVIDLQGKYILPGFVNTHVHTSQQISRGVGDDVAFITWLHDRMWPFESNMTEEDSYISTLMCCLEQIRCGVTAFAEPGGQFVSGMAKAVTQAGLRAKADLRPEDISLYIGIPFCPTRCAYCSFVSQSVEKSLGLMDPYLEVLCREITDAAQMVRETGLRIKSFYMGGGTPTTQSARQMDRLLTHLNRSFDLSGCVEYCIEAGRPDTITREKLQVLLDHGADRISVNPQSLEDEVLRAIGRRHTARDIEDTMALAASMGFPHVNMDLIAGLPADTPEGFRRTLDKCLTFGADNITVHTLSLKKGSRILLEGLPIPTAEDVARMLDYADPTLRAAGFSPYYLYRQKYMSGSFENVGWCISGAQGLYNIYIMEELHSILSLGAGGSTKMVDPVRGRIERVFHAKYPTEYIQRPEKIAENLAAFRAFHENMKK